MIRILLADDHDIVRQGLRALLESHEGWQVCGEARNGREAVEMVAQMEPDIAVLDLTMPELNGLAATRHIREQTSATEVLIFTMHESDRLIREVLAAGARGYVLKSDAAEHLVSAVESLLIGRPFFTSSVSERLIDAFLKPTDQSAADFGPETPLTNREGEIVQLLAEGKSNKEIAALLSISAKTVETHRSSIMRKIGVRSFAELVRYAIRNQIIEP